MDLQPEAAMRKVRAALEAERGGGGSPAASE